MIYVNCYIHLHHFNDSLTFGLVLSRHGYVKRVSMSNQSFNHPPSVKPRENLSIGLFD